MNEIVLRLFVAGHTGKSERAVRNLREICNRALGGDYRLTVVDVLEEPEVAEQERILATPTLVKTTPPPTRRLVGDLSDAGAVLRALDLDQAACGRE